MSRVSPALRRWFVLHFAADLLFAVPLLVAPRWLLGLLGWVEIDPVASRLVGAALLGIGVQSLLGRNEGDDAFRAMLNLKILWSAGALVGLGLSLAQGAPPAVWGLLGVFAAFHGLWVHYRLQLRGPESRTGPREQAVTAEGTAPSPPIQ